MNYYHTSSSFDSNMSDAFASASQENAANIMNMSTDEFTEMILPGGSTSGGPTRNDVQQQQPSSFGSSSSSFQGLLNNDDEMLTVGVFRSLLKEFTQNVILSNKSMVENLIQALRKNTEAILNARSSPGNNRLSTRVYRKAYTNSLSCVSSF